MKPDRPAVLLCVLILALLCGSSASAGWSRNNPYRTYNITGLNYGSQNWERQYGNQSRRPARTWRGWRR